MGVAHHQVEHVGRECRDVAARYRHGKADRIAPHAILLNTRNAGHRSGGDRGDYLRVAPTENLAGEATQQDSTTNALRCSEAGAGNRDMSSGASRGRAYARDLRRIHVKWYRIAPDAVLQDLGVAGSRSTGYQSDDLDIAPALYDAIGGAQPHLAAALGGAEARTRDRHRGSGHAAGRCNAGSRRGTYVESHGIGPSSALLHLGSSGRGIGGDRGHNPRIAPAHYRAVSAPQPHGRLTPRRSETRTGNGDLQARRARGWRQAADRGHWSHRKAHSVASHAADRHYHGAGRSPAGHADPDARGAPTVRHARAGPVKRYRAAALGRAEVAARGVALAGVYCQPQRS